MQPSIRRRLATMTLIASLCLGVAVTLPTEAGSTTSQASGPAPARVGEIQLTATERAEWAKATATAEQRAEIVRDMKAAFSGVARVGLGGESLPSSTSSVVSESSVGDLQLVLAYGVNSTHFWITASYADMAQGAIWVAVRVCFSRGIPSWVCNAAGNTLSAWAAGWGSANNHGVWAAVYWAPPRFTGGRW